MKSSGEPLYDGKPLDFSLEPVELKHADSLFIEEACTRLLRMVEGFTSDVLGKPDVLKQLGVVPDLDPTPSPLGLHIPFARFDFLYDGRSLNVLELNTDGASGFNIMEWLGAQAKIKDSENPNKDLSLRLLKALREHNPAAGEVGLVDFHDVKTYWEQESLIEKWNDETPAKLFRPDIRSWSSGALIYRRALSWHLRAMKDRACPFLDDWKEKKITVVGGWSSDVGMSKAWPALIQAPYFPETHLASKEFVAKIKDEKDQWILKGVLSFAGRAVIRGVDLSQEKWLASLEKVSEETLNDRPWVAQKFVPIPLLEGKPCEFGLYFLNGIPSGYMCRWGAGGAISDKTDELMRPVRITSE